MPGSGMAGGASNSVAPTEGTEYDQKLFENGGQSHEISDIGDKSKSIIIRSHEDNEGKIYLGWDEEVNDTNGFYLKPDEFISMDMDIDSQSVWIYTVEDNEIVMILAAE